MHQNVITIDGPAGAGKTSVSRAIAKHFGWKWVSTGAFYRGLAYVALEKKITPSEIKKLVKLTHSKEWEVLMEDETLVHFRNKDVTQEIKSELIGVKASIISQIPEVRQALLKLQRDCAIISKKGLVAEGRDCGSVVFPEALLKIYLTAESQNRAQRRATEQGEKLEDVAKSQKVRDSNDSQRAVAPLSIPKDAVVIDTTELTLEEVIESVLKKAEIIFK